MQYKNAFIFEHPLIQHKISLLRDKNTNTKDFRQLVEELATLMCYEITKDLPMKEIEIETPICKTKTNVLGDKKIALVPVLRAGLGMVSGMQTLLPNRPALQTILLTRAPGVPPRGKRRSPLLKKL